MSFLRVWSGQLEYPAAGFTTLTPSATLLSSFSILTFSHLDAASAIVWCTVLPIISSYLLLQAGQLQPSSWAVLRLLTHIANAPNGEVLPLSLEITKSLRDCILNVSCLIIGMRISEPLTFATISSFSVYPFMNLAASMILKSPYLISSSASLLSCMSSAASGTALPYFTPQIA